MSDEPIIEPIVAEEIKEEEAVSDPLADLPEEDRKYAKGWNPDDPKGKSLSEFVLTGKLIEANVRANKVAVESAKMKIVSDRFYQQQIAALKMAQREAVSMSDHDAVDKIANDINLLKNEMAEQKEPVNNTAIKDWESNNQWIFDESDPRTPKAKQMFSVLAQNYSIDEALEIVDAKFGTPKVDKETRAPKTIPSVTPSGRPSKGDTITMRDVTSEEMKLRDTMFSWATEAQFLAAVKKSREA